MHIQQADKKIQKAFKDAVAAGEFAEALRVLVTNSCTARPSDSSELRDAVRANPALLTSGEMVPSQPGGSGRREVNATCLEPDKDEHGVVVADWLSDPVTVEDRFPHFSSDPKAAYRVRHYVMMGAPQEAITLLREWRLSCRRDDYGGELHRAMRGINSRLIIQDGRSVAIDPDVAR